MARSRKRTARRKRDQQKRLQSLESQFSPLWSAMVDSGITAKQFVEFTRATGRITGKVGLTTKKTGESFSEFVVGDQPIIRDTDVAKTSDHVILLSGVVRYENLRSLPKEMQDQLVGLQPGAPTPDFERADLPYGARFEVPFIEGTMPMQGRENIEEFLRHVFVSGQKKSWNLLGAVKKAKKWLQEKAIPGAKAWWKEAHGVTGEKG